MKEESVYCNFFSRITRLKQIDITSIKQLQECLMSFLESLQSHQDSQKDKRIEKQSKNAQLILSIQKDYQSLFEYIWKLKLDQVAEKFKNVMAKAEAKCRETAVNFFLFNISGKSTMQYMLQMRKCFCTICMQSLCLSRMLRKTFG